VAIRVDAEGLRVADGVARSRHARLAVVTPSHQSPLGVALSLSRRLALLSWAGAAGAFVEGHFARHVKRMRDRYGARRQALAAALSTVFGAHLAVDPKPGGMHLIARCAAGTDDVALAKLAQAAGLAVEPLSTRALAHPCGRALLLSFTNVEETAVMDLCRRLERTIGTSISFRTGN
jgi:GntR family transcriptional regulator/MocR family aminotransferase